jgi:branched-chain amino acid transport system ATP-binding protein
MMQVLRVEGLSKSFGGLQVLQEISFSVEAGEKIAIIGPNGAGKTTLFNLLGGQLSATEGHIYLAEEEITHLTPDRRLHLGLARSYQLNNLFFNLPLLDNMLLALFGAEHSHIQMFRSLDNRNDLLTSAQNLLEPMDLWEKRFDPVATLSYGDQRLVEIAFALASKPKLVVLDEPSAGLPTAEAAAFANKIRSLSERRTLIFCAHDMDLVFNLADKIMVLYFGQIIAQGYPQDIKANPKVQEIYLGSEEPSEDVRSRQS